MVRLTQPRTATHPCNSPLRLDRRTGERRTINGKATAVCYEYDQARVHNRIQSLELIDISDSGLGAVTDADIPLNTPVSVMVPAHGNGTGLDLAGRVVRNTLSDTGRRIIGIAFHHRPAA